MKRRGATSSTPVNENDYSDDPHYAYKPLSFHATRAVMDADYARRQAIYAEGNRLGWHRPWWEAT